MVKPEQIGRGTRLRFNNDAALYYANNVRQENGIWVVYVYKGEDTSRVYRKIIKNVRQLNGKTVLNEGISLISAIIGRI